MLKTYPTLYSRDSSRNVRIWYMEQDEENYRMISGLIDGQLVTSDWTKCKLKNAGKKNETTPVQQCESEINSRYTKQLKTGYFENVDDIDNKTYFSPMLAKSFYDYEDKINFESGNYVVQCKYNGIRCITSLDSYMKTREGELIISAPHVYIRLLNILKKYPHITFDGELFNETLREKLNEINKLVRKTVHITDEDIEKSKEFIKYYIYDCFDVNNPNWSYSERKKFIDNIIIENQLEDTIKIVETIQVNSREELNQYYEKLVQMKHEGIMIRDKRQAYEYDKRSKYLLKYKPIDDDEFLLIGVYEGKGNWSGKAKTITLMMDNGKCFNANFKGTQSEAKEFLYNHSHLLNKKVTIYFNGFTGKGTPNNGQFDINNYNKR
jgi:DNA ligase-1